MCTSHTKNQKAISGFNGDVIYCLIVRCEKQNIRSNEKNLPFERRNKFAVGC